MRTPRVIGHITPQGMVDILIVSTVGFCRKCLANRLFVNLREWPGEDLTIGECGVCGNTQCVHLPKLADAMPKDCA